MYAGKQESEQALGSRVIKDVSQDILDKGYHLFYNNYFSGPALACELLMQKTYSTATVNSNRKALPQFFKKSKELSRRMERAA